MTNRSLLAKKINFFYNDIQQQRTGLMQSQTDLEFNQNEIKELNKSLTWKCFIHNLEEEMLLLRNKKIDPKYECNNFH